MGKLGDDYIPPADIEVGNLPFSCQWILSVLNKAIAKTVSSLDSYEFSDATTAVYSWWQFQLCDVFIEVIKPFFSSNASEYLSGRKFAQDTLWVCLENGLRLLHPFMPFVTEELWQRLPSRSDSTKKKSIMICEYPSPVLVRDVPCNYFSPRNMWSYLFGSPQFQATLSLYYYATALSEKVLMTML